MRTRARIYRSIPPINGVGHRACPATLPLIRADFRDGQLPTPGVDITEPKSDGTHFGLAGLSSGPVVLMAPQPKVGVPAIAFGPLTHVKCVGAGLV